MDNKHTRLFCLLLWNMSLAIVHGNFRIDRHCTALKYELDIPTSSKILQQTTYGNWWLHYWDPTWSCPLEEKIQKVEAHKPKRDGSKWICDVPIIARKSKCIVYSLGSHGDFSFEEGILERLGCEIHIFDLAAYSPENKDKRLFYHKWGVAAEDNIMTINNETVEFRSLPSIVQALGHEDTVIDLLKMDIEGCEFGILDDLSMWQKLESMGTRFEQLQAEIHLMGVNHINFKWRPAIHFTAQQVDNLFHVLHKIGYAMFHKEVNVHPAARLVPCEFAFVKLDIDCARRTVKGHSPYLSYVE